MNTNKLTQAQIDARYGKLYEAGQRVALPGGFFGTVVANRSMRGVEIEVDGGTILFFHPSQFQVVS